jgi:formylmethanofuran dehydrogenase subunit E
MAWTDDPVSDYDRYSAEQERKLEQLPRCSECDEPIQDDFCYEINDEYICEKCLKDNHRKLTEDLI